MTFDETIAKIKNLEIQSGTNVAIEGLKALEREVMQSKAKNIDELIKEIKDKSTRLASIRSTEPALRNGLKLVDASISSASSTRDARELVSGTVKKYITEIEHAEERIWEIGERRIMDGYTVLTHCHSTAVVGILKKASENGKEFKAICTETRPLFQGRITARELVEAKIPTTMIVDSAARKIMNDIDLFMFGADAVTSDGFVVNKIGTSLIALAAKEARTMTCTACETFKFDPDTLAGEWEPIEKRDPSEVWESPPKGLSIYNPAFDFTPPELVDFLICEEGIINTEEASRIMREKWGMTK
ncbi:MAG: S-methyl-5-thioribose-1-phosphate isomerase [Candidatus Diapherotrites archaeon]|nr:S-methyl-5-thioribose-1-phosphate isomerase [Candidatus Diapherotrites archaeon]